MNLFSDTLSHSKESFDEDDVIIEINDDEFESYKRKYFSPYYIFIALFSIIFFIALILIPSFLSQDHTKKMGEYNTHSSPEINAEILIQKKEKKEWKAVYN